MLLKMKDPDNTILSPFDLYGGSEVALSKAFSYLISKNKDAYVSFMKLLPVCCTEDNCRHKDVEIQIEKNNTEGRTDIEIESNDTHIIIECKINSNKISDQLYKYTPSFSSSKKKVMCFITQERESHKMKDPDINYTFLSWLEIIDALDKKENVEVPVIKDFLAFANRRYKMNYIKEILIQDLYNEDEINRFRDHRVYRRDVVFGTPLYFAPYFTQNSKPETGISYLSKISGVLTISPSEWDKVYPDLKSFTDTDKDDSIIERWIEGIKHTMPEEDVKYTYYFLDKPLALKSPLLKDKGSGKEWIARNIPKNRTVSFANFLKHILELK